VPAGYYSDDEYVSDEDEKDDHVLLPTRKIRGIQPPANSQHFTNQPHAKDAFKSSLVSAREWGHGTCAIRAPGNDPVQLRKKHVSVNQNATVGPRRLNTGTEFGGSTKSRTYCASTSSAINRNISDDNTLFGVSPKVRMETRTDKTNWEWVEKVLKIKSGESATSHGSQEVRI